MKTLILLAVLVGLTACTPLTQQPVSWDGKPNPLDKLSGEPTAAELHQGNIRAITSNPGYHLP
jgi:hypothetical protein